MISRLSGAFIFLMILICLLCSCSRQKTNYGSSLTGERIINNNPEGIIMAGFSAVKITPEVPDRWSDKNNDAGYNPKDGDTFTDGNGNGIFDPVWIAGFDNSRAANGIHDDLWARTMVIDDGKTRIAIVSLDLIGFMNNNVNDVRRMIPAATGISYLIITSTHTHEAPDLLGLWGRKQIKSGVNKEYLEFVKKRIVESVENASEKLLPVTLEVSEDLTGALPLVEDSRPPVVLDPGLRMIKAVSKADGKTVGTLISWGDHPETLWGKNLMITSDFPHYLRDKIENGIMNDDTLCLPGTGGIAVYINGAIGGLMTTSPRMGIKDPFSGEEYKDPTFEKSNAQGTRLAMLALKAMNNPCEKIDSASISLIVREIRIPMNNRLFKLAKLIGVIDRGTPGLRTISTEVAVFSVGPVSFATFPGEVYPEIVNGGIESPAGNDFPATGVDIPPIRSLMSGKYKFIIGLANDELGYIIPQSQWDTKPPFTYGKNEAPYGEENSMGPETATILCRNLKEMLGILK